MSLRVTEVFKTAHQKIGHKGHRALRYVAPTVSVKYPEDDATGEGVNHRPVFHVLTAALGSRHAHFAPKGAHGCRRRFILA